jgi:hypothetical protein
MANCPNCGSDHIQLTTETNVDWGRAAVGWALFGVVGGAVGAVTGDDRKAIICLNCGNSWKPQELYNIITTIENLTQVKIDLKKSSHRIFVNNFISQMTSQIKAISATNLKGEEMIKQANLDFNTGGGMGCLVLLILSIGGLFTAGGVGFVGGLIFGICAMIFGALFDATTKGENKRKLNRVKFEVERMKMSAKDKLNVEIQKFMIKHPLD